jgi:hypothetical protein
VQTDRDFGAIALLILPADAQSLGATQRLGTYSSEPKAPDSKQKERAAAAKAYKDALHGVPEQKPSDPWAKMR